jgi:putative transposase
MARLARVVVPGIPHHITQRGNRRQEVFFRDEDYQDYLDLISHWCGEEGVEIWSFCLMPNHVHLIVAPREESRLSRAIGEAHRRYTRQINFREKWRGYLWQGLFGSFPLDEPYLLAAARYVERNPVKAGMVRAAWDYPWSSVHAHLSGRSDGVVTVEPLLMRVDDWKAFITASHGGDDELFLRHERSGRPLGDERFVEQVSKLIGRDLMPKKPGRKRKGK